MTSNTRTTSNPESLMTQGHIWVAPVWNHKKSVFQPRPILIVGNSDSNDTIGLVVNFITKQPPRDKFDVTIEYWKESGLVEPSWVRTAKPLSILRNELSQDIVERNGERRPKGYIGKMHDHDLERVIATCKEVF